MRRRSIALFVLLGACASAPPAPPPPKPAPTASVDASAPPIATVAEIADAGPPPTPPPTMPDPPVAADDEAIAGYVLVWHDAKLYAGPSLTEPSIVLATLARPRGESLGSVAAFRALSATAAFVEVEVLNGEEECGWSSVQHPDAVGKVTVFVRRADLAPVVGKRFETTFPDGASVRLDPGLAVVPDKNGRWAISLPEDRLAISLPSDVVRHAYTVRAQKAPKPALSGYELARATAIPIGDGTFDHENGELIASRVDKRSGRVLFPIASRCSRVVLSLPESEVKALPPGDVGVGGIGTGHGIKGIGERFFLPAGVTVSWGSGHRTGVTKVEIDVKKPDAGATEVCAPLALEATGSRPHVLTPTAKPERTMTLCAPIAAMKHTGGQQIIQSKPLP